MSSHTPGPWHAARDFEGDAAGLEWGIFSDVAPIGFRMPGMATTEANARLIAAAPDLLAALRRLLEAHEWQPEFKECGASKLARAAIAKATGS